MRRPHLEAAATERRQLGASPDLIDDGLAIVADELVHSQLSAAVYVEAGGTAPPALDRRTLALPRRDGVSLEQDVVTAALQVFCLNETVAVPLFAYLRATTTVEVARTALDRILRDEVRHRDFGWACAPIGRSRAANRARQAAIWMLPSCCHASPYSPEQDGATRTLSSRNRCKVASPMTPG